MTEPTTISQENQAIIDIALQAAEPALLEPGKVYLARNGDESELFDLTTDEYRERQGLPPIRKAGTFNFTETPGFCNYIKDYGNSNRRSLWADRKKGHVTAIINGHDRVDGQPGWGDHRAVLTLTPTKEWTEWMKISGEQQPQDKFAEFLEDHLGDVREPDAAQLLEIATSISASTGTSFSQAIRPNSGEVQFSFVENIEGRAGRSGQLKIPTHIQLGITPWEGLPAYKVQARFRFRLNGGKLTLGVVLDRPDDVLRAAFGEVLEQISTATALEVFHGTPA
jgi:uncharacterized protein YfdQ (DUF2303 family)